MENVKHGPIPRGEWYITANELSDPYSSFLYSYGGFFLRNPQIALQRFYNYEGPEDAKMDYLILAGEGTIPIVRNEIIDK